MLLPHCRCDATGGQVKGAYAGRSHGHVPAKATPRAISHGSLGRRSGWAARLQRRQRISPPLGSHDHSNTRHTGCELAAAHHQLHAAPNRQAYRDFQAHPHTVAQGPLMPPGNATRKGAPRTAPPATTPATVCAHAAPAPAYPNTLRLEGGPCTTLCLEGDHAQHTPPCKPDPRQYAITPICLLVDGAARPPSL